MTPELWWAIGGVAALYIAVRWGLPALGLGRNCCGGPCAAKQSPSEAAHSDDSEDRWSKTQPFTETTVQIPPDPRK